MKRILTGAAIVVLAAAIGGGAFLLNSPLWQIYLPTGTGLTAKQTCSMVFLSGLEPGRARAMYTDPLLGDFGPMVQVEIDADSRTVTASVLGILGRQTAAYREGLGCTLVHGNGMFDPALGLPARPADTMLLDTAHRGTHFDTSALEAAIDAAFSDDGRNTLGVAVFHQGRLVAERYADGVNAETPLHGWSMTKSLAATMAGVLVQRGLLDIHAQGLVPALAEAGRPEVTVDQLLRMTGGLAGYEINDGTDPNSQMLFTQSDMARFAATREQIAAPGERWDYQSGNTVLAGSALETLLGDTPADEVQTIRDWLFDPLGMNTAILEADENGTLQWSSYMYASARDWGRLGQLYLNGGRAPDGTQIIPEDWVDYVRQPTPGSDNIYGSGFWMYPAGLPEGTFIMNGFQGQVTFIIPAEDLVVVRLGATNFQNDGAISFANDVVAARR
ncbi:serine hydrolase [Glycocaulis albus]|jgi:CubicO group peptidase (beta-lactamase class C family)|uniref:Serine hydrolase n=1 Tax=Glycocaulis albus TaxID=1382801 RepID=A0ABQ1XLI6_9PROT|nr:serine hydrolase [Glycocaulis albus]MBV5261917.1 serine hydrolase [Synechococcus moorigangaii CMS01]GGG97096.1 serine hydrolase [Glycocaulis albus]